MKYFGSAVFAAVVAFIVYLLLSADSGTVSSTILFWSLPELVIGLLLSVLVGFLCRKVVPASAARILNPLRWILLIVYLVPFMIELLVSNLKVAGMILAGKKNPSAIRKVKAPVKTGMGLVLLSTSVTYQPGTVVVDTDETDNSVYIHFLNGGKKPEKTIEGKKVFNFINLLAWIRRICE